VIKAEGIFNKQMGDSEPGEGQRRPPDPELVGRIFDYGTLDIMTAADEWPGWPWY
jgi:hypothetical protein